MSGNGPRTENSRSLRVSLAMAAGVTDRVSGHWHEREGRTMATRPRFAPVGQRMIKLTVALWTNEIGGSAGCRTGDRLDLLEPPARRGFLRAVPGAAEDRDRGLHARRRRGRARDPSLGYLEVGDGRHSVARQGHSAGPPGPRAHLPGGAGARSRRRPTTATPGTPRISPPTKKCGTTSSSGDSLRTHGAGCGSWPPSSAPG